MPPRSPLSDSDVSGARSDGMLARLGKGRDARALALPVKPMAMRGRAIEGCVRAGPAAYGEDAVRTRLIEAALAFASGLAPKSADFGRTHGAVPQFLSFPAERYPMTLAASRTALA